jgi:hypothetical protein
MKTYLWRSKINKNTCITSQILVQNGDFLIFSFHVLSLYPLIFKGKMNVGKKKTWYASFDGFGASILVVGLQTRLA